MERVLDVEDGIVDPGSHLLVSTELKGFGRSYQKLHDLAGPGYNVFKAYSKNKFRNALHSADVRYHGKHGIFGEIFSDEVAGREKELGETSPGEGYMPVTYKVGGKEWKLWLPATGLVVPQKRRDVVIFFKHGILVPVKTVPFEKRVYVEKRYSELDLPKKEIFGFIRQDDYMSGDIFVGRDFNPNLGGDGRFDVNASRQPSYCGDDMVGVRPQYKLDIVG